MTIGAALAALQGFNDRAVIYHDEIINTYKASQTIIADDARRPLFYAFDWLAVRWLGLDVESLVRFSALPSC